MYIEKNGYVVMKIEEMSFYDTCGDFCDNIEEAEIYPEYHIAKDYADALNEDLKEKKFEVVRFQQTIWIDRMGLDDSDCDCECKCACECDNNCKCERNDIDDFGIPTSVLDNVSHNLTEAHNIIEANINDHLYDDADDDDVNYEED